MSFASPPSERAAARLKWSPDDGWQLATTRKTTRRARATNTTMFKCGVCLTWRSLDPRNPSLSISRESRLLFFGCFGVVVCARLNGRDERETPGRPRSLLTAADASETRARRIARLARACRHLSRVVFGQLGCWTSLVQTKRRLCLCAAQFACRPPR